MGVFSRCACVQFLVKVFDVKFSRPIFQPIWMWNVLHYNVYRLNLSHEKFKINAPNVPTTKSIRIQFLHISTDMMTIFCHYCCFCNRLISQHLYYITPEIPHVLYRIHENFSSMCTELNAMHSSTTIYHVNNTTHVQFRELWRKIFVNFM